MDRLAKSPFCLYNTARVFLNRFRFNITERMIYVTFIPYIYRHAPVPGGGFVTGFVFHEKTPGIAYARTDIGGVYRYEPESRSWKSLCDHVTHPGKWETYPLSIAVSPLDDNRLYIVTGDGRENNKLCISFDRGDSFIYRDVPTGIHGNAPGRGTGERLLCSYTDPSTLYFVSQTGGLFVTRNLGGSWEHIPVLASSGLEETNLTFLFLHPENENFLIIGTNGERMDNICTSHSPSRVIAGRASTATPAIRAAASMGYYLDTRLHPTAT